MTGLPRLLTSLGMEPLSTVAAMASSTQSVPVVLDGRWLGNLDSSDLVEVANKLRILKAHGREVSLSLPPSLPPSLSLNINLSIHPSLSMYCNFTYGAVRICHSMRGFATQPVILQIELGGKPKWPPFNFGYNDVMRTAPIEGGGAVYFLIFWWPTVLPTRSKVEATLGGKKKKKQYWACAMRNFVRVCEHRTLSECSLPKL